MIRNAFFFVLIFCALVSFGQNGSIPANLQVPAGSSLLLHTYAKGVQEYVYTQDANDTTKYTWIFKEPRANLYLDSNYRKLFGKHYFDTGKNPIWEYADGSKVSGTKIGQAGAPGGQAIPWLLLKAVANGGAGILTPAIYIQRIYTKGGKAPAITNGLHKGQLAEIPYTAEYLFYNKK